MLNNVFCSNSIGKNAEKLTFTQDSDKSFKILHLSTLFPSIGKTYLEWQPEMGGMASFEITLTMLKMELVLEASPAGF